MKGTCLRFYMQENRKHDGMLLYEWLLEQAKKLGIHGGSAFRAIAGYGRHGILHEQHFFELAGDLPVVVEFAVSGEDAEKILNLIRQDGFRVFYVMQPIEYGVLNAGENELIK